MDSSKKQDKTKKILSIFVLGALLIAGLIFVNRRFFASDTEVASTTVAVSGTVNINGVMPKGATITYSQREADSTAGLNDFSSVTNPGDGDTWSFNNATADKTYVIQGVVKSSNGVELVRSNEIHVTAPASNEVLTFNLMQEGLTGVAEISGIVKVNGFFPTGSTVSILGRSNNTPEFNPVVEGIPAFSEKVMKYDRAIAGLGYDVIGYLYDSAGNKIGQSDVLSVVAPARGEVLTINSTATNPAPVQPTAAPAKISGSIDLNGGVGRNTRIVILQRAKGTTNFVVAVDNIRPQDGVRWEWSGAREASWYDMVAVLKQRQENGSDIDVATSRTMTVAAPAINVMFTINSGIAKPGPSGQVAQNCRSFDSASNTWTTLVTFPFVDGARSYWYQIGTSGGGSDILNTTRNSTNQSGEVFEHRFNNEQTYFARFATATSENQAVGSNQFSSFSSTTQLRCTN